MNTRILSFALALALAMVVVSPPIAFPRQADKEHICVADVCDEDRVQDVLRRNKGRRVELVLVSGQRLKGEVSNVTPELVHLTELHHKLYFDAVVRIKEISAVIMRVRPS